MDNGTVIACQSGQSSSGSAAAEQDWTTLLWTIGGPTLLVVGLVGNVLILVTMTRRRMRGTSTCIYLCSMAVLDLLVLAAGLTPNWLDGAGYLTIKKLSPAACKLEKFLDYTTGDTAVWCRVAFTLDRLVAVLVPLYTGRACGRPTSARLYVAVASVAAVAKNLHVVFTRGVEWKTAAVCLTDNDTMLYNQTIVADVCGYPNEQYRHFERYVRPWLAFALVSAAPFIVIAVCNALIIGALVVRRRKMASTRHSTATSASHNERQFVQLASMCVAASCLFLVCSAPSIVLLIGKPYWNVSKGNNPAYQVSKAVSNLLFYVTFSANFFLYCMTGDRFRTTLYMVMRRCCRCLGNADRHSLLSPSSTSKKFSLDSRRQQRITSQRSTLTSSLSCAAVTVMPRSAAAELKALDAASVVKEDQVEGMSEVTAFTDCLEPTPTERTRASMCADERQLNGSGTGGPREIEDGKTTMSSDEL